MKTVIVCLVAILLFSGCRDSDSPGSGNHEATQKRRDEIARMVQEHYGRKCGFEIRGPLTLAQLEREFREAHEEAAEIRRKVYGRVEEFGDSGGGRACAELKGLHREGDELYFFTSDLQSWGHRMGVEGYVLVRKNEIIDAIRTRVS
jgi:hypothetical protein